MATAADPNTPPAPSNEPPLTPLAALTSTAITTFVALVWGAAMLAIIMFLPAGLWSLSKRRGRPS